MDSERIDSYSLEDSFNPEYAGFWVRVVAYLIDAVLLGVISYVISKVLGFPSPFSESAVSPFQNIVTTVVGFLYFALGESGSQQATVGKRAMGLVVTDYAGNRISFLKATGRYFGKILSALILLFGFFMIGWDRKKQGLHDKLAETLVVYRR